MPSPFYIEDSNGYIWLVAASPLGELITVKSVTGIAPNAYVNDPSQATSWQVTVTTAGILETTSVPLNLSYPTFIELGGPFALAITLGGQLETIPAPPIPPGQPSVTVVRNSVPEDGQIVPLTSAPNQSFATTLQVDGAPLTLNLTIRWNEMAGYWVMSISDSADDLLLDGIPLITGWYPAGNLLAQYNYLHIGSAFIINVGNSNSDYPGQNDLGSAFILVWDDTAIPPTAASEGAGGVPPVVLEEVQYGEVPAGVIDGVNTIYTLEFSPDPPESLLYIANKAYQNQGTDLTDPNVDYTLVGNVITRKVPLQPANPPRNSEWHIAQRYVYQNTL
jgi:hypothetical protein